MRKAKFFTVILIAITLTMFYLRTQSKPATTGVAQSDYSLPGATGQTILQSTVQIRMYPQGDDSYFETGLGTLIDASGDVLVYTHDHWHILNQAGKVAFYNAWGEHLLDLQGPELQSLVQYHDGGNLIFSAPTELRPDYQAALERLSKAQYQGRLAAAKWVELGTIRTGEVVIIARQLPGTTVGVDLLPAAVEAVESHEGLHSYRLRTLNGESIIPGDSGGGIWFEGQLVGNMWKTEYVNDWRIWTWDNLKPAQKMLDTSHAASLPVEFEVSPRSEAVPAETQPYEYNPGLIEN